MSLHGYSVATRLYKYTCVGYALTMVSSPEVTEETRSLPALAVTMVL